MEISLEFKRALEGAIPLIVNTSPLTDATTEPLVAAKLDCQRIFRFYREVRLYKNLSHSERELVSLSERKGL